MSIGTAFHERTFPLCQSLNYREWSGYYTVSAYEVHHEHEYNAIRNAAALIDITPLYKYLLSGRDATKLVNRIITRDINKVAKGQVIYCCWCDEQGKVIDDGTITRLGRKPLPLDRSRAEPALVSSERSEHGRPDRGHLRDDCGAGAARANLGAAAEDGGRGGHCQSEIFPHDQRQNRRRAGGHSRTGYTGDLGYEIWVDWKDAVKVWDAIYDRGAPVRPASHGNAGARCGAH